MAHPRYWRVKELFENLEAFQIVSCVTTMSQDSVKKEKNDPKANINIDTIYDLACGHGLLIILLA